MAKVPTRYLDVDPWIITEKGFHPDRSRVSESIFALANEYMGIRGHFDEDYSGQTLVGSFFNGVFEEEPLPPTEFKGMVSRFTFLANAVNWLYTRITLDNEQLDVKTSKVSGFVRSIDMRRGILTREMVWTTAKGKKLRLRFERLVSMVDKHLGAQRITVEALNFTGNVRLRLGLDSSILHQEDNRGNLWNTLKLGRGKKACGILSQTHRSGHRVMSTQRIDCQRKITPRLVKEEQLIAEEFSLKLTEKTPVDIDKIIVNSFQRSPRKDDRTVWDEGMDLAEKRADMSFDQAATDQMNYWQSVWDTLDITIQGDPENQQGIRFCVFQLHQSYHGVDPANNITAKGLTAENYWGVAWWDTETYCLPFYMFNDPRAARNLLAYRHRTLKGALKRAKELDCEGARYPMCTIDGEEACPAWQHGDLEIHVSAAVAYGIWHYDRVFSDQEFLYTKGIEMLMQISRYYASRGEWSPQTGEFGFWGVMGADEFHMMVHNNTYTNVMAKKAFEFTLEVMDRMADEAPDLLKKVSGKVKLRTDEPADWKTKAKKMRVLYDKKSKLYEQHDGYFDLPHVDVDTIPPTDFPIYKHWAYVRIFRYDMIKQPDVLLLPFFFSHEYPQDVKRINYDYYESRCSHESSLSPGIHAILASEIGKHDQAYDYSLHAARLDLDDYNRNTCLGLHTTSMAAAWMNLVYGFGGMRSDGDRLSFTPSLPKKWTSFSFRILYRGSVLSVGVDREHVSLMAAEGKPVVVDVFGQAVAVDGEGVSVTMPSDRLA